MLIEHDKELQEYNTLAVPSVARFYSAEVSFEGLRESVVWAKKNQHPLYILGGGSNIILPAYIDGLVLQPKIKGIQILEENESEVHLRICSGENWHGCVTYCTTNGFFGLENLALIPGDCGAAPIQNIGAYGVELKDVFISLNAFDLETMEIKDFSKRQCKFAYRDSIFKSEMRSRFIILDITLKLSKIPDVIIDYPALAKELQSRKISRPTPQDVFDAVVYIRQSKLPATNQIPNAGSFFKNPIVDLEKYKQLLRIHPNIVAFDLDAQRKKVSAAWLIENAGWKGKSCCGVKIHPEHALVLTNPERKGAENIIAAAEEIVRDVELNFGVALEREPQLLD